MYFVCLKKVVGVVRGVPVFLGLVRGVPEKHLGVVPTLRTNATRLSFSIACY
jgi:hypothetical protein